MSVFKWYDEPDFDTDDWIEEDEFPVQEKRGFFSWIKYLVGMVLSHRENGS